jgi:hypothetical protein
MTANDRLRQAMDIARTISALRADDLLSPIGLQRRRSWLEQALPLAGAFTTGIAVGAGLGVFLAPTSGEELRQQILDRLNKISDQLNERMSRRMESRPNGGREEGIEAERQTHA